MTMYTVHARLGGPKPDVVFVKDGFSWGAALFGFVWAFYIGAWDAAIVLIVVQSVAGAMIPAVLGDPAHQGAAQIGLALAVGFGAQELRRALLAWRGFAETDIVAGPDVEQAEQRFFDTHPDVTGRLLGAAS